LSLVHPSDRHKAIHLLDSGQARVAEQQGVGDWTVNEWLKKAVLLSFRLEASLISASGFPIQQI
jgi:2,3,4,5-tetrahydropyridine-2-carboxylate N-succinyltransferase